MFIAGVSMSDIPRAIYTRTVFGRGLPQGNVLRENPDMTAVMSEVVRKESIVCSEDYLASKPEDDNKRKAALRKIFHAGWLHTEIRADIDGILYTFASPLHRRCIDWRASRIAIGVQDHRVKPIRICPSYHPEVFTAKPRKTRNRSKGTIHPRGAIPGRILLRIL